MNKTEEKALVTRLYNTMQKAVNIIRELNDQGIVVQFSLDKGPSGMEVRGFKAQKIVEYGPPSEVSADTQDQEILPPESAPEFDMEAFRRRPSVWTTNET